MDKSGPLRRKLHRCTGNGLGKRHEALALLYVSKTFAMIRPKNSTQVVKFCILLHYNNWQYSAHTNTGTGTAWLAPILDM